MTNCPNCSHKNPPGATQCEACFTPLPAMASCPNCGMAVQLDATFCGQCGTGLTAGEASVSAPAPTLGEPLGGSNLPNTVIAGAVSPKMSAEPVVSVPPELTVIPAPLPAANLEAESSNSVNPAAVPAPPTSTTQLQQQRFQLTHVQSSKVIEIPSNLNVVHIGKPNEQIPPDIDVSGFPCSEVVSRVHADIRVDGDSVYLEDVGSANGTYVNHNSLPKGNRHLLRVGDRISLGKGDLVTFLFQEM
jgi:hypothetical protein